MGEKRIPILFVILTIFQMLHSAEEIIFRLYDRLSIVTEKINEIAGIFPIMHISGSTFIAMNILVLAFFSVICVFLFRGKNWAFRIARVFAVVEIINGLAHVSAAIYTGGYYPGAFSGLGLLSMGIIIAHSFRKAPRNVHG